MQDKNSEAGKGADAKKDSGLDRHWHLARTPSRWMSPSSNMR